MLPVTLSQLFGRFLRLGATAYGGPAMTGYLREQVVERAGWLSEQEFRDGMALCQITPGATMVHMATYVGYRLRRLPGATIATVGFVLPSFLLMAGLSVAYFTFGDLSPVRAVFRGLAAVVVAIILNACRGLAKPFLTGGVSLLLAGLAFLALLLGASILLVLVGAALLGILAALAAPEHQPVSEEPRP